MLCSSKGTSLLIVFTSSCASHAIMSLLWGSRPRTLSITFLQTCGCLERQRAVLFLTSELSGVNDFVFPWTTVSVAEWSINVRTQSCPPFPFGIRILLRCWRFITYCTMCSVMHGGLTIPRYRLPLLLLLLPWTQRTIINDLIVGMKFWEEGPTDFLSCDGFWREAGIFVGIST